ncbi:murein biosynthesis integral membrane protein MurJ [Microvirga pudoricolor]|uniref:murein biosynthesis integral membrane protein MurJ n=1 Tax=Microvirga pudoricolor TaxID=2778729 RepID=UPI00194DF420|nr:murein biosynthesis integral membrane protein MurJ [Microvirga pudoricolor]MBM6593894.1 murein biosynthesis integral membrane protein MurJ [Microvirga pudoricolor]
MSLLRSSLLVGLGAAASRVLGFVRDILFAGALGAGPVADAFLAAFRVPNLVRRVVGEGGLNPALIPALGRLESDEAARVSGDVMLTLSLILVGLTGLVELSAGLIAFAIAPGLADEGALDLVALYTRLGFPSVIGITLASVGAALLNLRGRFAAATLAPLAVNAGLIATLLIVRESPQPLAWKAGWLAAASSLAGIVQLAIVAAALWRLPERAIRLRRPRSSPALRAVLWAGLPSLAASGAAQLFILAGTLVASFWPSGVSWLYYAERVMQLPLGLVAALGSSVLLPELAARDRAGRPEGLIAAQNKAMTVALLLALPAATALVVLSRPIASVLFERGAFGPEDAAGTAAALAALGLGLPFAALGKVISQTLFARGALRGTVLALLAGIAATVLASAGLGSALGVPGIALGVSLACALHAAGLAILLRIMGLWSLDRAFAGTVLRTAGASLVLAAGLWAALASIPEPGIAGLVALCVGGLALYGASSWMLKAVTREDLHLLKSKPSANANPLS